MGGHGKQIDAEFFNISGNMPCRLHRIGMKIDARFFGDFTYITDRLDSAHFIIGMHHRNNDGFFRNCLFNFLRVNQAVTINRKVSNLKIHFTQEFTGFQYGMMFDRGGDDMIALARIGFKNTF